MRTLNILMVLLAIFASGCVDEQTGAVWDAKSVLSETEENAEYITSLVETGKMTWKETGVSAEELDAGVQQARMQLRKAETAKYLHRYKKLRKYDLDDAIRVAGYIEEAVLEERTSWAELGFSKEDLTAKLIGLRIEAVQPKNPIDHTVDFIHENRFGIFLILYLVAVFLLFFGWLRLA